MRVADGPGFDTYMNAQDAQGRTPLMYAVMNDDLDVSQFLLELGADPTVQDMFGVTAFAMTENEAIQMELREFSVKWAIDKHGSHIRAEEMKRKMEIKANRLKKKRQVSTPSAARTEIPTPDL